MKKVLHNKKKKRLVQDREQLLLNNASLEMRSTNANGRKVVRLSKSGTHLNLTRKRNPYDHRGNLVVKNSFIL